MRLIQPVEHGRRGIGDAVAVGIRQGHHLALGGEADQKVAIGVQSQDPGARQILGEYGDGKARGQLQGQGRGQGAFSLGRLRFLQELGDVPGRGQDRGPGPP